jgi:hypothetical protein
MLTQSVDVILYYHHRKHTWTLEHLADGDHKALDLTLCVCSVLPHVVDVLDANACVHTTKVDELEKHAEVDDVVLLNILISECVIHAEYVVEPLFIHWEVVLIVDQ